MQHHVASERITFGTCNLAEVHLAVHRIRMMLSYVVAPSRCTSRTACGTERYGIFAAQHTYADEPLACNHIISKDIVIVLDDFSQMHDELLHLALEVRMNVSLHTAYHIVILNQSSARSLSMISRIISLSLNP